MAGAIAQSRSSCVLFGCENWTDLVFVTLVSFDVEHLDEVPVIVDLDLSFTVCDERVIP